MRARIGIMLGAALLGIFGGAALAWFLTGRIEALPGTGPYPWETTAGTGEAAGSAFLRAGVARVGIWGLPQSEVVYFRADKDSKGRTLDPACDYEIRMATDLPARWWSVGVYRDYFWIPNAFDRYSFSKTSVKRDPEGAWRIRLSPNEHEGNWLPTGGKGRLTLLTRLYQPEPKVAQAPNEVGLPTIERKGCTAAISNS